MSKKKVVASNQTVSMGKQVLSMIELLAAEKSLPESIIFQAVELALASATQKCSDITMEVRVVLDKATGEHKTFRCWTVMSDEAAVEGLDPTCELSLADAQKRKSDAVVGEVLEDEVPSLDFGRIAAQLSKGVLGKAIRHAELVHMAEKYKERIGEMITGTVTDVRPNGITISLGESDKAELPRDKTLLRENLAMNSRVRVVIDSVDEKPDHGPIITVSRTHPSLLEELFKIEVPEIADGLVEIKGVARDPGFRAKIAVRTSDGRIDAVGACVGMRGARVQQVSNELNGERVEIILFDDDPAKFVINALAPAQATRIVQNEDGRSMDVAVPDAMLAMAIGRNGQNVRLASELTGWTLNVMSEAELDARQNIEVGHLLSLFQSKLNIDAEMAGLLVAESFTSLEEVAYVPIYELYEFFDAETAQALQDRAKDVLLTEMLMGPPSAKVAEDVRALTGMTDDLAAVLASNDIITLDELAELSVDEFQDIHPTVESSVAGEIIMQARKKAWELP